MKETTKKTPIALISGYLGSGKTTLLRNILQNSDRKLAILMNEFGEIAIDSKIIKGKNVNIAELAGGCVCCSLIGEFEAAVEEIIRTVSPDMIVVETTGVAEPEALVFNIQESLPYLQLDVIVTVADADAMCRFPAIGHTGRVQLETADVILINKKELVNQAELGQIEDKIKKINDMATIFHTSYCNMDTNLLFGLEFVIDRRIKISEHFHEKVDYFAFTSVKLLNEKSFENVIRNLPGDIYRAKGFVKFDRGPHLFNYVAGRWDLEEMEAEQTELVFIGPGIKRIEEKVLHHLRECEIG